MATFTEDFTKMRQEFDQSFNDRQEFVEQVSEDTATMLEDHRQWMRETGEQLRSDLGQFGADLQNGGKIFRGRSIPR